MNRILILALALAPLLALSARAEEAPSWQYGQDADLMSDRTTYWAKIESANTVEFAPPYSGAQRATLMLRRQSGFWGVTQVILSIERGQFLRGVLVRFDDKKAVRHDTGEPTDLSSNMLFIEDLPGGFGTAFTIRMLKFSKVRIAADIYQEGAPVFEFDLSGFDVGKYGPEKR